MSESEGQPTQRVDLRAHPIGQSVRYADWLSIELPHFDVQGGNSIDFENLGPKLGPILGPCFPY